MCVCVGGGGGGGWFDRHWAQLIFLGGSGGHAPP